MPGKRDIAPKPRIRIILAGSAVLLMLLGVSIKALDLQVLNRGQALKQGRRQHQTSLTLLPKRGNILDSKRNELAINVDAYSIYMRPGEVENTKEFAKKVSKLLKISRKRITERLNSGKPFYWLKRLADAKTAKKIEETHLKGLGVIRESKRTYPNDHLAGQVIGFTDIDSKGIEGLEYEYENTLSGSPAMITIKKDGRGREIIDVEDPILEGSRGRDIELTLDSHIQYIVETELKAGVEKAKAQRGMAVMTNTETGAILAMASYPFNNPNAVGKHDERTQRNLPVWYAFEPGSTMKVFLIAAALEEKKVTPSSSFHCLNGRRKIGKKVIRDLEPHGVLSVGEILKVSSNIGASLIAEELGKELYYDYLRRFGFGAKTGIDLPGESNGRVANYKLWGPMDLATQAFGQGMSVTALQMARALSAIANGGYMTKPYIVQKITGSLPSDYKEVKPRVVRRVISYDVAKKVTAMMEGVVSPDGTGKRAVIPGYRIAGKTGTAQMPDVENGGYYSDRHVSSFIGFAPADDPKFTLVVVLENPRTNPYGGVVAAPIFKSITEKVLFYMGVPPEISFAEATIMPNLMGLSARDVLMWSEREGIKIKLRGSGYVVVQKPSPGVRIRNGTVCQLQLKQNL